MDYTEYDPRLDEIIEENWSDQSSESLDPEAKRYLDAMKEAIIFGGSSDTALASVTLLIPILAATYSGFVFELAAEALLALHVFHGDVLPQDLIDYIELSVPEHLQEPLVARYERLPKDSWRSLLAQNSALGAQR